MTTRLLLTAVLAVLLGACSPGRVAPPPPAPPAPPAATPPAATPPARPQADPATATAERAAVLSWHREGGIAGFCDDLVVYLSGEAVASSCRARQAGDVGRTQLSEAQLAQLQAWVDRLQSFDSTHRDPAVADAMTTRLVFVGRGGTAPTQADRDAMSALAAEVFAAARR